jgi:hypothetical protein
MTIGVTEVVHTYVSSNWTPSDVTCLPQTSRSWGSIELFVGLTTFVAFVRQMCTQLCVMSQDYNSINYSRDYSFLLVFARRQNIQVLLRLPVPVF